MPLVPRAIVVCLLGCWVAQGWADEPRDRYCPAAVTATNIPAIPNALMARLEDYQNIRAALFCGWDPQGTGMLIQTRFGATPQLHRVDKPGGRREQLTFFREATSGKFLPKTKTGELLISYAQGGNEKYQVSLHGPHADQRRLLTDGTSRNEREAIRDDGKAVIIRSTRRNGRDGDLILVSPSGDQPEQVLLQCDNENWHAVDWSPQGDRLLLLREVSVNEIYPALLDVASKKVTPIPIPGEPKSCYSALRFAPEGNVAYVVTDTESEYLTLAQLDLATMKYTWITQDLTANVAGLEVDSRSGNVAFTLNQDGVSRLFVIEQGKRREIKVPQGVISGLEFSPDSLHLGFTLALPDAPADAYSIQLKNNELTQWTFSELGGLDRSSFIRPRLIQYRTFDGRLIPAFYYAPANAKPDHPVPVIVHIHGGPEMQYQPVLNPLIQIYLHELGAAVICPNVRGSAGYGKSYLKLDDGLKREDAVRDIGTLLDWVGKQRELDAKHVAVVGGSYGGFMVLSSLTHYSDRLRAGVDIVGIANFITFLENTSPYRQDLRRVEYGDERDPAMRAFFEKINPTANADKITADLMVIHGENDPRVPLSEAKQIAAAVAERGRTVWSLYANNEGHGFEKKENRDYQQAAEVLFLQQALGKGAAR